MNLKAAGSIILFLIFNLNLYSSAKEDSTITAHKSPRIYKTTRLATERPVIDGNLNDLCWLTTGEWAGNYTQWIPNEGAQPSRPTELKVLYDDKNIYVAIRAFDDPQKIIRKAGRRDEFNGDCVGINFDSYHDHRTGFEFNVTAAGQKVDLLLTNPSNPDYSWNAVWYVEVGMEDSAWTAEYEIPLSQLRYSSDEVQIWGMHSWRWIDRLAEESDWEPQSSQGAGILYQFGELHGIKDLPPSRRIEIMPYSLGELNTFKAEQGNPFADKGRSWLGNAGLDAKIGLSTNFTSDLTINPDFGQVESDPSVMNLTAFETFYEERRPFFLEGKNIFSFDFDGNTIFYSRRIGHSPSYQVKLNNNEFMDYPDQTTIISAIKLSGKSAEGLSVGLLQSITSNEKAEIKSTGTDKNISVEPLTSYTIARLQQDFSEGSTVLGGILTSTNRFINDSHLESMNRNAFTGGLDFLHYWNDKEFFVDAIFAGSFINGSAKAITELQNSSARFYNRPDAVHLDFDSTRTTLSGHGARIKIGKGSKGLWRYSAEFNWRSPGLDLNDLGFMQTADIFKEKAMLSYFVVQPVSIFRTYTLEASQTNNWDYGINYLSSEGSFRIYLEFLNNWAINTTFNFISEALDTRLLRGGFAVLIPPAWSNDLYFRTDPSEKIYFDLTTNVTLGANNSTHYYLLQPGISVMPSNTLKLSMSLNFSSNINDLQYVDKQSPGGDNKYILAKIDQRTLGLTFRIDYNITPEFSIQYYGSPFASVGKYSSFKVVSNPKAENYIDRFTRLNTALNGENYDVFSDNLQLPEYSFKNPDFNFHEFRSNFVIRWEYRPGSQIYLVWSQDRSSLINPGDKSISEAFRNISKIYPDNIFLIKFNYWFSI
ncbi:MAG TPA: DUF5916 domain-containing protein [Ignavibacteriaceae bacterium]|nr:DUF5916 domain-containing protein [Ignavibacteriaceae bacterium]